MLYFPRNDDTSDLKKLIKFGAFTYGKQNGIRFGSILIPTGDKKDRHSYSYDYNIDRVYFNFDRDYIYYNDEPISLSDLLVGKAIRKSCYNDNQSEIDNILEKRGLGIEFISLGYTTADFYEGESFGSTDTNIDSYLIIKK